VWHAAETSLETACTLKINHDYLTRPGRLEVDGEG
jgi:hypothetical protein